MASLTQITSGIKGRLAWPQRWPSWARIVSDILSPPLVWAAVGLVVGLKYSLTPERGLLWAWIFGLFICLIPILYVGAMVQRGHISDIHMQHRKERYKPMLVTIGSAVVALLLLDGLGAPRVFPLLALISLVQVSLMLLITLFWQISMHMMSITAATVALSAMFAPTIGVIAVPFVVLVGAARLRLKRHTPLQVLAGTLVGGLVPIGVLYVLSL